MILKIICNQLICLHVLFHTGNTPLIYGAMVGNVTAVEILCRLFRRLGLGVEHKNQDGYTALLVASKYGHKNCVLTLLEQGKASPGVRDDERGWTAAEWLREKGYSLEHLNVETQKRTQKSKFYRVDSIKMICGGKEKSNSM